MRISREQALDCFRSNDLVGIGMEADAVRRRLHPEGVVSYVLLRNVDCAATMDVGKQAGYGSAVGCVHQLFDEIGETVAMGSTGVRLVFADGGETLGMEWLEGLLRGIRQRVPALWIEGLTAAEVSALAGASGLELPETLARLREAGLDSIAGDGAAVNLHPSDQRSPGTPMQQWVAVHRAAHHSGMRTAATMVFGAGETLEQRVDALEAVRQLQEETGGFAAFVPAAAEAPGGRELDGVTAVERLKMLAISRMFLDNVENVQSSRAGQGLKVLQTGLRFGANDAGPVDAGAANGGGEEDLRRVIRDAGFKPVERDALYRTMYLN